jgi:hypothetical protein
MWLASAATPLIKNNNAINIWIKEPSYRCAATTPRASMKKDRRLSFRVTALFKINFMTINRYKICFIGFYWWK